MKQIKIEQVTSPNKESIYIKRQLYKVHLGNGFTAEFSDKKKVSNFLNETNTFFNSKLHELNFIYIEAFSFYRVAWFFMDHNKNKKQLNFNQVEQNTNNAINQIDRAFNFIVSRSSWANGNFLIFNHFNNIINPLIELLNLLLTVYKSKGHTDKVYKIGFLLNQVENIKKELENYPNF